MTAPDIASSLNPEQIARVEQIIALYPVHAGAGDRRR
jgi:hypothetical protein